MPIASRAKGGVFAALTRFGRERRGATAVEFALVAGPFFFAVLATMEIAMVLWTGEVLEKAVATASRKIYTGEFQTDSANASMSSADLRAKVKTAICAEVTPLITCNDVAVDVREVANFAGATPPSPITAQKTYDTSSYNYASIRAKEIGLVTASVEYRTFFPPLAGATLANGNRVIMATAAFRAEPYAN